MLATLSHLKGFRVDGTTDDEKIGKADEAYFDDEKWVVRYLIVDAGSFLFGKRYLISPASVSELSWEEHKIRTSISRRRLRESPDIDVAQPISRRKEAELAKYYRMPVYWNGMGMWGAGASPVALAESEYSDEDEPALSVDEGNQEHLRSSREVVGYAVSCDDGTVGTVSDFVFDDRLWAIRYLVVDTKPLLPGKEVLVSPEWVRSVTWLEKKIEVQMAASKIKTAPEYHREEPVTRDYEEKLHRHYGKVRYWL